MKTENFERLAKQLEPPDELTERVLTAACAMTDSDTADTDTHMKGGGIMKNTSNAKIRNRYGLIISSAAALLLTAGGIAVFTNNTHRPETAAKEGNSAVSTAENTESDDTMTETSRPEMSEPDSEDHSEAETLSQAADESMPEEVSCTDEPADVSTDDDWRPDIGFENYDTEQAEIQYNENGEPYALSTAVSPPTYEYHFMDFNNKTYRFACGSYGEIYEFYTGTANIPNSSYIGEFLGNVEIPSSLTDIRPSASAEVYSLKTADKDFMTAVRFEGDPRYYLYADTYYTADSFAEFMSELDLEKYAFDGEAIVKINGGTVILDNDSELVQAVLSADGARADEAYGELYCTTYLDTPIYGGSLGFEWYSGGYVTVIAFGERHTFETGSDTFTRITEITGQT